MKLFVALSLLSSSALAALVPSNDIPEASVASSETVGNVAAGIGMGAQKLEKLSLGTALSDFLKQEAGKENLNANGNGNGKNSAVDGSSSLDVKKILESFGDEEEIKKLFSSTEIETLFSKMPLENMFNGNSSNDVGTDLNEINKYMSELFGVDMEKMEKIRSDSHEKFKNFGSSTEFNLDALFGSLFDHDEI